MKSTTILGMAWAAACVSARPQYATDTQAAASASGGSIEGWAPAGADDFRGPCPMMNTLANHGYLPRDGRNLTESAVVAGLKDGLNFAPALGALMFKMAVSINPAPNATFFTLDMLNAHNALEHDASLSRADAFFGNNHVFNETVFAESIRYWPRDTLDANQLAMSKLARQAASKALNPEYTFTTTTEQFSLGEVAAPVIVFGDHATSTVNKSIVEFFFRNEKLPSELGWTPQAAEVTVDDANEQSKVIADALNLFTPSANTTDSASHAARRRAFLGDFHGGFSN